MSVTIKNVGKERIHVKTTESTSLKYWELYVSFVFVAIGALMIFLGGSNNAQSIFDSIKFGGGMLICLLSGPSLVICLENPYRWFIAPSYYIDTTMYGIGGITIRKVSPDVDHIAICKTAHELEKQMLERTKEIEELKKVVGNCD